MVRAAVDDLADQYRRACRMLYAEVDRFGGPQWASGISFHLTPARLAMHIFDCLDYYFSGQTGDQYRWGHRFGGGWWELPVDRLPDKAAVLAYGREIESRILAELAGLDDGDLSRSCEVDPESGATLLGHYVYAIRHTMHHHGELAALSVHHGNEGGSWE